jgi:hypothetical protein
MSKNLERQLQRAVKNLGEDSFVVKTLRDQISSESRHVFTDRERNLWITGSKPRSKPAVRD